LPIKIVSVLLRMNLLGALAEVRTDSQLGAFDRLDLVTGDTL
jgi:hypothetical protein